MARPTSSLKNKAELDPPFFTHDSPIPSRFGLDIKSTVETGAEILQGDSGGQFDHLFGGKSPPQTLEKFLGNCRRRRGHGLGIFQNRFLQLIEKGTLSIIRQIREFFLCYSRLTGETIGEIDSENALDGP